jgi:protein SCO1/2
VSRRVVALALGVAALGAGGAARFALWPARGETATLAARSQAAIPSAVFTSHLGEQVRLGDAMKDRVAVLAFAYLRCTGSCPKTAATLREVQRMLGDRVGRDVAILTVSLDPEHDTPEALARHARELGAGPGWTFLTGAPADVDAVRRHFGLFDRYDPDAPRTSHAALVVVGDARSNRWFAIPGPGPASEIAQAVLRLAPGRTRALAADARAGAAP